MSENKEEIVSELIKKYKTELDKDIRPWGGYITLWEDERFKVKILFILPKKRLSLQRHKHRKEKWFIVEGEGLITKGNSKFIMREGNSMVIEEGEMHRIENISESKTLKIIEIWLGEILDEKDIERIEDDFGRI
ncbi:Mannose-6-phosphate isomerase, cupin superfamily [Candidatus Kryptobacter tengchongensis]|nr:Mannose-6-phosphate isomerase, cupin superfamily [Candidatus Kryptobacter tengchongensis]